MFKTKLFIAIAAMGMSAAASAAIDGSSSNGEFVFSAFDTVAGVGYTYELDDAGFDSLFGSDVRMNSLIGSTNTPTAVGFTLTQNVSGVVFDYALPSFTDFVSGANMTTVKWNLAAADTSGLRRIIQTVTSAPVSAPYTNAKLNESAASFSQYADAVNAKGTLATGADGFALTLPTDLTAYAGNAPTMGVDFGTKGYANAGGLNDVLDIYVFGGTSSSSSSKADALYSALLDQTGNGLTAKVYMADDGMYHLQLAVAAVPEPSTYAMLLAGLGMLGFAARRARRS
jgi:hypothetical protein